MSFVWSLFLIFKKYFRISFLSDEQLDGVYSDNNARGKLCLSESSNENRFSDFFLVASKRSASFIRTRDVTDYSKPGLFSAKTTQLSSFALLIPPNPQVLTRLNTRTFFLKFLIQKSFQLLLLSKINIFGSFLQFGISTAFWSLVFFLFRLFGITTYSIILEA